MKQRMKKILLVLCMMALCLTALAGCSTANATADEIEPEIQMALEQGVPQTLQALTSLNDADLEAQIAQATKKKDFVSLGMLQNWQSSKDDLGAYVSGETPTVEISDDGYIARMNTQFANRTCVFSVIVDDDLNLTSVSFTPAYTMGEKMTKAALNTVMGMGVVFAVLILFSVIIYCFRFIGNFEKGLKKEEAPAPAAAPAVSAAQQEADNCELIAVMSAAIQQASKDTGVAPEGLSVTSVKRS